LWFLHRKGQQRQLASGLTRIRSVLGKHHSKDPVFLNKILAAIPTAMKKKHPTWRCSHCHVVMKGTFPRCWKCGTEWQHCNDASFVPPEVKQAYDQQTGQQASWMGTSWQSQSSGSRSPRTRSRKHNQRGPRQGGEQHYQDQGYGKGQPMMPMHQMMPMMMPYQPHMMPAPLQPPVMPTPGQSTMMDKGTGKGKNHSAGMQVSMIPPPPPMPATGSISQTPGAQTSWASSVPMMPFPAAPAPTAVPVPQEDPAREGKAQKNLNRLLKEMKKEEDTLSPNLQSMAHEMKKQDEKSNMQGLHTAVRALGYAKDELLEAENARVQLLTQWKHFLQQSVIKWKEFTMNFQASDSAHQANVHAARLAVRKAQRAFDLASKREHIGKNEPWPVSDEEETTEDMSVDPKEESAQKIHDGMSSIVTSLEELSSSADLLEQRVKRPRTSGTGDEAQVQSFGKAGDT